MRIHSNGYIGIGTKSPTNELDIDGKIRMRDGAQNGYIPVSDANGVMTWSSPNTLIQSNAISIDSLTDAYYDNNENIYFGNIPLNLILSRSNNAVSNIAIGHDALKNNIDGSSNVGIGAGALTNNTTGEYNVAIGQEALDGNTQGVGNTSIGRFSMLSNTTGYGNVALGVETLLQNTTGNTNVAISGVWH